jgi:hypothetical protein
MMVDYLKDLHPFYVTAVATLKKHDLLELTEAMAHIVSVVPLDQLLPALQNFLLPLAQRIHEIASTCDASSAQACKELEGTPSFLFFNDFRYSGAAQCVYKTCATQGAADDRAPVRCSVARNVALV